MGFWQLGRAAQKLETKNKVIHRSQQPVKSLPEEINDLSSIEFSRFAFKGVYEPEYQILLDNQIHQGQAGYHVITPVKILSTDKHVLVNRGWIPWGESRESLPTVETPREAMQFRGRAVLPSQDYFTLEKADESVNEWQTRWQHLDLNKIQAHLPFSIYPLVIELDVESTASGFVRNWLSYDDTWIQRHRAYAFQWFSLAILLAIIWIVFAIRVRRGTQR